MTTTASKLNEASENLNLGANAHYVWLRSVLTMASGVLAILVTLKKERSATMDEHHLFMATIASLALGILFGVIAAGSEAAGFVRKAAVLEEEAEELRGGVQMGLVLTRIYPPR